MTQISKEGGYISFSNWNTSSYFEGVNVTLNAISLTVPTSIKTITSNSINFKNVEIFCSRSLHVVETLESVSKEYSCENSCPVDFYTFQAGTIILEGDLLGWNQTFHHPINETALAMAAVYQKGGLMSTKIYKWYIIWLG